MTEADLDKIIQMPSAAIIAPAGHGKTEMIADIVKHADGKQLLLTHTNAGVDAIEKRLQKRKISKEKYTVTTIAAFCINGAYHITTLATSIKLCPRSTVAKRRKRIMTNYTEVQRKFLRPVGRVMC